MGSVQFVLKSFYRTVKFINIKKNTTWEGFPASVGRQNMESTLMARKIFPKVLHNLILRVSISLSKTSQGGSHNPTYHQALG